MMFGRRNDGTHWLAWSIATSSARDLTCSSAKLTTWRWFFERFHITHIHTRNCLLREYSVARQFLGFAKKRKIYKKKNEFFKTKEMS